MARSDLARYSGLAATALGIALTELFGRVVPTIEPTPAILLLATLAAVAYAGLAGGFRQGALSSALLGAYTLHFLSPPGVFLAPSFTVFQGALIMTGLGLAMSMPMALVKLREDRLRRQLVERAALLESRNRDLTEANGALEAFGYVVSHDLKEPVRAIKAYLESAREEPGSKEASADIEKAYEANERLGRLLQGLLEYSRASSLATTKRALDVREVLQNETCRAQYEGLLREKGASLEIVGALPKVEGDEVIVCQLFGNLVLNAVRHGGAKPTIVVRPGDQAVSPGRAHIIVEDDGPGFPDEVLKRFQTLRSSRPATVKSGFGLIITHRAAQRLDGRVWIENRQPAGARVHIDLPAAQ